MSSEQRDKGSSPFDQALAQARAGIDASFEILYRELAGPLSGFAAHQGSDDPDGVANAALFQGYKSLSTFEGDFAAFRAFVFRIARNRIIDDFRKLERRPRLVALGSFRPAPVPDDAAERMGAEEWVTALLQELTDDQRTVITLRVLGDISLADTALIMEKPINAVKALQRRAIRRLHALTGEAVHE